MKFSCRKTSWQHLQTQGRLGSFCQKSIISSAKFSQFCTTEAHPNPKPLFASSRIISPCNFQRIPQVSCQEHLESWVKVDSFRFRVSQFCLCAQYFSTVLFTLQMMSGLKDTRYNSSNYTSRDSSSETDSDEGRRRCFKNSSWSRYEIWTFGHSSVKESFRTHILLITCSSAL